MQLTESVEAITTHARNHGFFILFEGLKSYKISGKKFNILGSFKGSVSIKVRQGTGNQNRSPLILNPPVTKNLGSYKCGMGLAES